MNTFGNVTPKTIILTTEAHKLHRAFIVGTGAKIWKGQQVKLNAVGDVVPTVAGDGTKDCIGVSIHTRQDTDSPFPYASEGAEVTVVMRGYITILQKANAALVPGPVKLANVDANGISRYINTVNTGSTPDLNCDGWSLDVASAQNDDIRVVLK